MPAMRRHCLLGLALTSLYACSPATAPGTPDADVGAPVTCAAYCARITSVCTDTAQQYNSASACVNYCERFGKLPLGTMVDTAVNSVGCRMYHVDVAETVDRDTHCTHAGPTGGNECGSWCDNYCHLSLTNCTGSSAIHANLTECLDECAQIPTNGNPGDQAGDTIQCRIFWLGIAQTEPPSSLVHCADGDGPSTVCQ
jgi:hypothetical protein